MSKEYLAETVNPAYAGMVARIKFKEGKAIVNEEAVAGGDRDLPEVIRVFKDLGIKITEIAKCPKCGKICKSAFGLHGHMKTHAGEDAEEPGEAEEPVKED